MTCPICGHPGPTLLDLFCGAGGCTKGYQQAGFHVTGVDNRPQPRYVGDHFIQADALDVLSDREFMARRSEAWGPGTGTGGFDVAHASPPCQAYTVANNIHQAGHPDLLPPTRELLMASGLPWVIENVPGAPMHVGPHTLFDGERNGVLICGLALGLNVKRHRWFEANVPLQGTRCPPRHPGDWLLVFGHTVLERGTVVGKAKGGGNRIKRRHVGTDRGREAMGITWMTRDELSEAIPPAYTEFIGEQLLAHLAAEGRAVS